jgi:hypothetical protein
MIRLFAARLSGVAAVLILLLAACGATPGNTGDSGSAASQDQSAATVGPQSDAGALDVCAMLTDAQVEEATGFAVVSKEPGGGQGFADGSCRWVLDTDASDVDTAGFIVSVQRPGGRAQFDILASEMPHVPDLGDDAYRQGDSIWAVKGDALVVLAYSFLSSEQGDPGTVVLPLVGSILSQL